jgi:hypothetical protein
MSESVLPKSSGSRPKTTPTNPHTQLEQNPERKVVDELATRVFALPGVEERPSAISVPGTRALWLREGLASGPQEAFMIGREFAHIHPMPDASLHAALPPEVAQEVLRKGWAEQHPVARMGYIPQNVVMIYAPRDAQEIEVVAGLVDEAYRYASRCTPFSSVGPSRRGMFGGRQALCHDSPRKTVGTAHLENGGEGGALGLRAVSLALCVISRY